MKPWKLLLLAVLVGFGPVFAMAGLVDLLMSIGCKIPEEAVGELLGVYSVIGAIGVIVLYFAFATKGMSEAASMSAMGSFWD